MTDPPIEAPSAPAGRSPAAPAAPLASAPSAQVTVYRVLVGALVAAAFVEAALFTRLLADQRALVAELRARAEAPLSASAASSASASGSTRVAAPAASGARVDARPDVTISDLSGRLAEIERDFPDAPDSSVTFFNSPRASVHMHVMGREQICPLHLHRASFEATAIVSSVAHVTNVFGKDGALVTRTADYAPGAVISSPPECGHEWVNPSKQHKLGNLVFAAPAFDLNQYVRKDDPRMLKGAEPLFYEPTADLDALANGAEPSRLRKLDLMDGRMSALVVKTTARIEVAPGRPIVAYVLRGQGWLDGAEPHAIKATTLAVIDHGSIGVRAEQPTALLLFDAFAEPAPAAKSAVTPAAQGSSSAR